MEQKKTLAQIFKELEADFQHALEWLKKEFANVPKEVQVAIVVVEKIKSILTSPVAQGTINVLDFLTKSGIPSEVAEVAELACSKSLALLTSIELTPAIINNPNQLESWVLEMLGRLKKVNTKDTIYSTVGADVLREIMAAQSKGTISFGTAVGILEDGYKEYKKLKNGNTQ